MDKDLYHHGIKGQKWGVKNGPPYPLNDNVVKQLKTTANESSNLTRRANSIRKTVSDSRVAAVDLSSMSDQDLKDVVNRMNLEQQYYDLSTKQMAKGKNSVETTLSIAGEVLASVGSALAIALAIKNLKG